MAEIEILPWNTILVVSFVFKYSLPKDKFLDWSKFKAFADDKIKWDSEI